MATTGDWLQSDWQHLFDYIVIGSGSAGMLLRL